MKSLLGILIVAVLLPSPGPAESVDVRLFRQVHERWQRPWLDGPMEAASTIGDGKVGIAVCCGIGLFGGDRGYRSAKLAITADAASGLVSLGLKTLVNRRRPEGEHSRYNSSFPSGHATGAFALATVFSHQYPRLTVPCYVLASAVGLSRIYLGRHYPLDVLCGAVIGYLTARIVIRFRDTVLGFSIGSLCPRGTASGDTPPSIQP